tara:strand:- start:195 stop:479 length:285 start_codon:yes stop_codon:yes gene_type:complete
MVIFYDSSSFAGSSDSSSIITFAPRHPGSLALRPSLCIGCGLCVRIDRVLATVTLPVLATDCLCLRLTACACALAPAFQKDRGRNPEDSNFLLL